MKPNVEMIKELMAVRQWSASELARQMGISRSETTRLLNGKRNGGNKVISGLIKAFPEESLKTLFFLPTMYPNVNANDISVSVKKSIKEHQSIQIKHPNAHQLACTVNEEDGLVEIKQGNCITTLVIPPGPVGIKYSTNN